MTLQEQINAASSGAIIQHDTEFIGNLMVHKSVTIKGSGIIRTPDAGRAIEIPPGTGPISLLGKSADEPLKVTTGSQGMLYDIIRYGSGGFDQDSPAKAPQGLTIEYLDVCAQPNQEVQRGISANGANFSIKNSRVREIHGKGYDTQAICAWNGPGPFTILDCYLEASGENVMFGGADARVESLTPADIEIRRCHFFKPLSWKTVWTVKNLFETKNCKRLIVDGSVFENCWVDAQVGFAILIKANNQDNTNPWATTDDLTFSNNIIKGATHGLNIMGIENPPKQSGICTGLRFINNLWEVEGMWVQGFQGAREILLDHNTFLTKNGNTMTLYSIPAQGFVVTNNLGVRTGYGIKGDGTGEGAQALEKFAPGYIYQRNVLAGAPASQYPADNFYPATWEEVKLGSDYKLASDSPFKGKGTDGKDPGCDIDQLLVAQTSTQPIPTPAPAPSPTPTPSPATSPDGTKGVTITDSQGAVWTIGSSRETLKDNVHMGGGFGDEYKWLGGVVYVRSDRDWYQWTGSHWAYFSSTEPGTSQPAPTPEPAPAPQPAPSPTPSPTPPAVRKVAWPSGEAKQDQVLAAQWQERYRLKRHLRGSYAEFEHVA